MDDVGNLLLGIVVLVGIVALLVVIIAWFVMKTVNEKRYKQLRAEIIQELGFSDWNIIPYIDTSVVVKSRQALEKYDEVKFFKENRDALDYVEDALKEKRERAELLEKFLEKNDFQTRPQYERVESKIDSILKNSDEYRICVNYISSAGNNLGQKLVFIDQARINQFRDDPSLLMGKGEYNKYLKEQEKEALNRKNQAYYGKINNIIDYANENKDALIIKGSQEKIDNLITQLFDRTVNSIKKIKTTNSEEWDVIDDFIVYIENEIGEIVGENKKIFQYYESTAFKRIKQTCASLMKSQREFNEYIDEKVQSISTLFGTRIVRNETTVNDEYNYIRPYKKTITPFTAEVSATVFASAENNPLEYVVKYFYPDKKVYPEQIQKLQLLVEELETLKEAKQIIENYKKEYQQYLQDVPNLVLKNDEAGFYSRLGFAYIDENVLTVEYKFVYTSNGGMAQRSFTIPMTEETIIELVKLLESKLTISAFAKEQRILMTKKLRDYIKKRDNYTCCICGNSIHNEPNLLLEIDHIIPVAKGGLTEENNLQTLCWKCNRSKGTKII